MTEQPGSGKTRPVDNGMSGEDVTATQRGECSLPAAHTGPCAPIIRGESEPVGTDASLWWLLWAPLAALALAAVITGVLILLGAGK